jgi:hypothetical protein
LLGAAGASSGKVDYAVVVVVITGVVLVGARRPTRPEDLLGTEGVDGWGALDHLIVASYSCRSDGALTGGEATDHDTGTEITA